MNGVFTYNPFAGFSPLTDSPFRYTLILDATKRNRMKQKQFQTAYPLSPMQQGMLFHALRAAHTGVDIEQVLITLPEVLDAAAFEHAWQRVVRQHDILRTSFHWSGTGEPLQAVETDVRIPFRTEDWQSMSDPDRNGALEDWLKADRLCGFDVSSAPLMRVTLFRTGKTEWQLVWTFHHLLLDWRGIAIVLNDVFAFYEAFQRGEDVNFPQPPPFRDHVEHLRSLDRAEAESFWREVMKGFTTPTPLALPRLPERDLNGKRHQQQELHLSEETTAALNALAAKNDLTLNTLMQAAWALLLARYSGTRDVVFGAVRSGRRSSVEGADSIAGLFINTVPVRVHVEPEMQLLPWLATLRANWIAIRPFEHTALTEIQGWTDVPRETALFETLVNFQPRSMEVFLREQGGNWTHRNVTILDQPNYPLILDAHGADALRLKILYDRSRFDDGTVIRMIGHLRTLVSEMIQTPDAKLGQLSLLTTEEKRTFETWNCTAAEYPRDKCIHELFEDQAQRTPDALAISAAHRHFSYAELNYLANRVASQLRLLGVGPEVRVGLCMERSFELVLAELAVLKAGGAYVPLDPASPNERLAFMLQDSQAAVLLIREESRKNFQFSIPGCQIKSIESLLASEPTSIPHSATRTPRSNNLAYVIYTSGSTGTPKGVEIEHSNVLNLIAWHQRTYQVTSADRATLVANPAFDASVWELWPYLTAGASIHIPDHDTVHRPAKLVSWLVNHAITLTFIPTPLAEALFDEHWPQRLALRAMLIGGDKMRRPPPLMFPCPVFNHYGPTEYTVVTTSKLISPENHGVLPIGRPISNTKVFILDEQFQPAPIGVPGEFCISGDGLARGYVNRPELTAEKFVGSVSRMYRTGDLARWLPDGDVEFLGRRDNQIKIRGHRIELGEIESVLLQHEGVRKAAVVTCSDSDDIHLAAFLVSGNGAPPSPESIRKHAKQYLPDYMLPESFVVLDALPVTPNGKLDRKALAARAPQVPSRDFVAPRSPTEKSLAAIWKEVLGKERIGIHDNFFQLGGHSLLAARVISRIANVFRREFPLRELFDSPTIAAMAERIEQSQVPTSKLSTKINAPGRNGHVPISFAQERLWFLEQLQAGTPFNNIPFAFEIKGPLDISALETALDEVVRRHEVFRTRFVGENGQPVAVIEPASRFKLSIGDLGTLPEAERHSEVIRLTNEEAQRPFDLSRTPLLRASLLRFSDSEHRLLLTTHHIVCDGWSADVLLRELSENYTAALDQQPLPKRALPWSYADFAEWQRQMLREEKLEQRLTFWKQQLADASKVLDLPTDNLRPPVQTYRGSILEIHLPPFLSTEITTLSQRESVTPFMLLLAALQTVLHRYSGQAEILIGTPIAGRSRVETENLIGLFLNTVVLRGDLSGDPTFRELLQRVRKTALDAFAHQDLPFEKLAEALQPQRDLSRSPLFQVMFVLQNESQRPLKLAGLETKFLRVHSGTAKFDLTLSLEQTANDFSGYIEYNTDLFEESTIKRFAGHFQKTLQSAVANHAQRLSQLPLLTEAEQQQLGKWNDTQTDFPNAKCIHDLFEEQVARTPDAVALVCEDEQFTYRELNERANDLTSELRALGVGPDVRVGICVGRSLEMMVGLLGILKAGGCYVPLDPTYPRERLAFMLEDSEAAVLLIQDELEAHFKFAVRGCNVRSMASLVKNHTSRGTPDPKIPHSALRAPHSNNLAYVIYTSGSTGKPKGVMLTHRNVVNFFTAMDRELGTEPGVWLAVTSISFDISVLELFWTLTRGYKVVIQQDELPEASSPRRAVAENILHHGVTHLQCTPSLAGALVLSPDSLNAMRRLKNLLLGGEALPADLARQLRRELPGHLLNMYGPTETTIWSATHHVQQVEDSVPIGRPIANTQIHILDKNLRPVPVGVPGELLIGGEGVARGYLNRPELTAEKFIPDPFNPNSNARLYRTGDLARWRTDGTIEFLGRLDQQVKLRGHRIELGEIESVLREHPAVQDCAVVAVRNSGGDDRLAGYVVPAPGQNAPTADLRQFLESRLPDYMIPSAFMILEKLPLTPNGKLDRKALPQPESRRPDLETAYLAPRSAKEQTIAGIWRELLRVEQVGLNDNFFDLGGHSLLVVQAQAKLRNALGVEVPIVRLFQYPTISALANFLGDGAQTNVLKNVRARGQRQREAFVRRNELEVVA